MKHASDDLVSLQAAEQLVCREVAAYLAEDRHWQEATDWKPGAYTVDWPEPKSGWWWQLYHVATEYAWNKGRIEYFGSMGEKQGTPRNQDHKSLPDRWWSADAADPRYQRLARVVTVAVRHAMQVFHERFRTAYIAGARQRKVAATEQAIAKAVEAGKSVEAAGRVAGVSRATAYRRRPRSAPR